MKPMINLLTFFYSLLSDNFGLSIIVFTVIIRILLIPLAFRQVKQMLGMQSIQPKLKVIQAKYKDKKDRDSRQKMSQETMNLYKQSGVNPVGCLGPMFIQLPIWIGLYRAIFKTVPSTPEGLSNLSTYLYSWNPVIDKIPLNSFFIGIDLVNPVQQAGAMFAVILPLTVAFTTFAQQKVSMFKSTDERQEQTNRMMLWMMPVMFGFFTLSFPAGLATYIIFSNIAGFFIQLYVLRKLGVKKSLNEIFSLRVMKKKQNNIENNTLQGEDFELQNKEENNEHSTVSRKNRRRGNKTRTRGTKGKSRRN
jgi:YidC/Oxa1 family membrane protein insertase